ncbi:hypothetical protein K9L05_00630 [Candidatus Babeliales bacterium]|nr:hypothetical protein [Candidatus Babeliales bacterium]MCF7899139.1 hypothetical protein [Candidatus Babeliales bacterium]
MKKIFSLIFCSIFVFFAARSMEDIQDLTDQLNNINETELQKHERATGFLKFLIDTGRYDGKYIILNNFVYLNDYLNDNTLRRIILDLLYLNTLNKPYKGFINKIKFIDLRNNRIQHLPREILKFPNLKIVNLKGNNELLSDYMSGGQISIPEAVSRNFLNIENNSRKKPFIKTFFVLDENKKSLKRAINSSNALFASREAVDRGDGLIEFIGSSVELGIKAVTAIGDLIFKRCGCVCNKQTGCTCLCGDKSEAATAFALGLQQPPLPPTSTTSVPTTVTTTITPREITPVTAEEVTQTTQSSTIIEPKVS